MLKRLLAVLTATLLTLATFAFAAELRAVIGSLEDAAMRHALEQHARSLEHAAALGDVAAASLTDRGPRRG